MKRVASAALTERCMVLGAHKDLQEGEWRLKAMKAATIWIPRWQECQCLQVLWHAGCRLRWPMASEAPCFRACRPYRAGAMKAKALVSLGISSPSAATSLAALGQAPCCSAWALRPSATMRMCLKESKSLVYSETTVKLLLSQVERPNADMYRQSRSHHKSISLRV